MTIVGWGVAKGPILEAIKLLEKEGIRARMLQVVFMEPFPAERVREELKKTRFNFLFESNKMAQLGSLIKLHAGVTIGNVILRYDGRPFNPDEISAKVLEAIKK